MKLATILQDVTMKVLAEFRNNGTEGIGCLGTRSDARLGIGDRRSHTKHTRMVLGPDELCKGLQGSTRQHSTALKLKA